MELDQEPPEDPDAKPLMTDEQFEDELALAAEGRWDELGLDPPGEKTGIPGFERETVEGFLQDE